MKPQTEAALRGLLAMDDEIAPEALEKAVALLRGDRDSSDLIHVLKFKEVMSLLHIHRRTLEYYLARGYLTRVYGGGRRALGISRDSFIRFTTRRCAEKG